VSPPRRQFLGVLGGALAVGVVASLGDSFAVAIPAKACLMRHVESRRTN